MINYPTNRTEALARLPENECDAAEKAFNQMIFAKLDHYANAKVCALGEATSLPSTSKPGGVRGVANTIASAADPVVIKLIPAEATIARLFVDFRNAGYIRATNEGVFPSPARERHDDGAAGPAGGHGGGGGVFKTII